MKRRIKKRQILPRRNHAKRKQQRLKHHLKEYTNVQNTILKRDNNARKATKKGNNIVVGALTIGHSSALSALDTNLPSAPTQKSPQELHVQHSPIPSQQQQRGLSSSRPSRESYIV